MRKNPHGLVFSEKPRELLPFPITQGQGEGARSWLIRNRLTKYLILAFPTFFGMRNNFLLFTCAVCGIFFLHQLKDEFFFSPSVKIGPCPFSFVSSITRALKTYGKSTRLPNLTLCSICHQ